MKFNFDIRDSASPALRKAIDALSSNGLAKVHRKIGRGLVNLVRGYFIKNQTTRHATADRLGAQPTNYWGKAAESVLQPDALSADENAAVINIAAPGISRAMGDIEIFPTEGRQYLTIPIASESYGNAILMGHTTPRFENGFFFTSKKGNLIYAQKTGKGKEAQIHPRYLLKPSVHQEQDRTLLPSDEEFSRTATHVLALHFRNIIDHTPSADGEDAA